MFTPQEGSGGLCGFPRLACDGLDEVKYNEGRYQPKEECKELHEWRKPSLCAQKLSTCRQLGELVIKT